MSVIKGYWEINQNIDLSISNKKKESLLVVGEVQSGKTKTIIDTIIEASNENYNLIIVFSGTTKLLDKQNSTRIEREFKSSIRKNKFFHKIEKMEDFPKTRFTDINTSTHVFTLLKGSIKIREIQDYFFRNIMDFSKLKVLIIDDESDFASPSGKKYEQTKINSLLSNIYKKITLGKYVFFTATPFANILTRKDDGLYYDKMIILKPYPEYCGSKKFLMNKNCYKVCNCNNKNIKNYKDVIKKAFIDFFISSYFLSKLNLQKKFQFLINVSVQNTKHAEIKKLINEFWDYYSSYDAVDEEILKIYKNKWKIANHKEIKKTDDEIVKEIETNFKEIFDLKNCEAPLILNKDNKQNLDYINFKGTRNCSKNIIIGGNLLSRGITFEYLTTEVMLNSPEENLCLDTLLQRARWFGNRQNIDFISIYINRNTKNALMIADKSIDFIKKNYSSKKLAKLLTEFDKKFLKVYNLKWTSKPIIKS